MKRRKLIKHGLTMLSASAVLGLSSCSTAPTGSAEIQTTGAAGSPNATTTISGRQLPAPDPRFDGVIKDNALQSKAWWAPRVVPPKDAPNVLLIITDDAGFGVPSTFGGVIPTPTMDRIANNGLRYNNIHRAVLADAGCAYHRSELSLGRFWRDLRANHGFPRL